MSFLVAKAASRDNIPPCRGSTILVSNKVLTGASKIQCLTGSNLVSRCELIGVFIPHRMAAIIAMTMLMRKCFGAWDLEGFS